MCVLNWPRCHPAWCVALFAAVVVLAGLLGVPRMLSGAWPDLGEGPRPERPDGLATAQDWPVSWGPEADVEEIVRAVYERDLDELARCASPEVREGYGGREGFDARVREALAGAPEMTQGRADILDAAPLEIFGDVVPYNVAVADPEGRTRRLGVWLVDGERDVEYCWIQSYPTDDPRGTLMRDLVGSQEACLKEGSRAGKEENR